MTPWTMGPVDGSVIEASGAGVALGGRPIVRDIDVAVRSGEVVALLGANGSGKSTLVKAMVGLHPLSTGSIRLFGQDLTRFHDWHRLGYVPQRSHDRPGSALDGHRGGRLRTALAAPAAPAGQPRGPRRDPRARSRRSGWPTAPGTRSRRSRAVSSSAC